MPHIVLRGLRARALPSTGLLVAGADAYLHLLSHPPALLRAKRARDVTTRVQLGTADPEWREQTYMVRARVASADELAGAHLVVAVMQYNLATSDTIIGCVTFALGDVHARTHARCRGGEPEALEFRDEPIMHCGKRHGFLSGSINILWPTDPGFPHGAKTRHLYENRRTYTRTKC